jgi:DegV family protein with EDD domain
VDLSRDRFYRLMAETPDFPFTSQPSPEDFAGVYEEACRDGAKVVSIHLSSNLSGTFNSALLARRMMAGRGQVEVIDSRALSVGLGLVVRVAAMAARRGDDLLGVAEAARQAVARTRMLGIFTTLGHLSHSGRVNRPAVQAARMLGIKPLFTLRDGEFARAGFVRTVAQGLGRMADFVKARTEVTGLGIVYGELGEHATDLRRRLEALCPGVEIMMARLGPALGTHGGPGVLGMVVQTADPVA